MNKNSQVLETGTTPSFHSPQPDFSIEPLSEKYFKKASELFSIVFQKEKTEGYWKWLYSNPFAKPISYIAKKNETLIGHCLYAPFPLYYEQTKTIGYYSILSMVHPEHQKKGVLKKLCQLAHQDIEQEKKSIFTFVNQNSYPVYSSHFGYQTICSKLPIHVKILDPTGLHPLLKKTPLKKLSKTMARLIFKPTPYGTAKGLIKQVTQFDKQIDVLWESLKPTVSFGMPRNSTLLNYRFSEHPDTYSLFTFEQSSEVKGLIVTKIEEKFGFKMGYIMEWLFPQNEPQIGLRLLHHALQIFENCSMCTLLVNHPWSLRETLKQAGFYMLPSFLFPHPVFFCTKEKNSQILNPANWFLSYLDHDAV